MVCNSRVRNRTLRHAALAVIVWTMLSICLSMLYITDGFTAMKDLRHFGETRTDKVQRTNEEAVSKRKSVESGSIIHIAFVVCGSMSQLEKSLVMVKSALLFAHAQIFFHILADLHLQNECQSQMEQWPPKYQRKLSFRIYNVSFPMGQWKQLFRPCSTQRLFLHSLLPDVDALIYVDTDTLFLSPVDDLWSVFSEFNSTNVMAASTARESPNKRDRKRNLPTYTHNGVGINAGVMLMNLTRLRASKFSISVDQYYKRYASILFLADQDLLNVYFYFHSRELFLLSCQWNYCNDYCKTGETEDKCKAAEDSGVRILHGKNSAFQRYPTFRAIYNAFAEYDIHTNTVSDLLWTVNNFTDGHKSESKCAEVKDIFVKQMKILINYPSNT